MSAHEGLWKRIAFPNLLLLPFSGIFFLLTSLRRFLYRSGILRPTRLSVPVVVVGNLSVGGTGKTPLVLWLAQNLRAAGCNPGIVSRGYGGSSEGPLEVKQGGDPAITGDEPQLLATIGAPVWIGKNRADAARSLLAKQPQCDIIILDDGLQHYALARDCEIAVVDGNRIFGNKLLLPAGPLREPVSRLQTVDAIVVNSAETATQFDSPAPVFRMTLQGGEFYSLQNPSRRAKAEQFRGKKIHAMAGIGNPQRFFASLKNLGIESTNHEFGDHHAYRAKELHFDDCDILIMTEKDAVKCAAYAHEKFWVYPVQAQIPHELLALVLEKKRNLHGSKIA